jgi:hypothetical protein
VRAPEAAHGQCEPQATYEIGGQHWHKDQPGFTEAMARAHEQHLRPRCLCRRDAEGQGIEMYVARLLEGYIVKRMPNTGSQHATHCPSYEPPAELSGLGPLLGTAIVEDPTTGQTNLRLDFPMTKMPWRSTLPAPSTTGSSSATSQGHKLTLRALLHYLWDQAELTKWHPGFAGKRTWGTVRRQLLSASEDKFARGDSLRSRLYIPETFFVDEREALIARRSAQWLQALSAPGKPQSLMLLICEIKEIVPARYGFKAIVKHVPEQTFALDEQLYRRLGRRFKSELTLWGADQEIHMVMVATFGVSGSGVPIIQELCLMPVTRQWLPVENEFEKRLLHRLISESRSFVKALHYNLSRRNSIANVLLTDTASPVELHDLSSTAPASEDESANATQRWAWNPAQQALPALPVKKTQIQPICEANRNPNLYSVHVKRPESLTRNLSRRAL